MKDECCHPSLATGGTFILHPSSFILSRLDIAQPSRLSSRPNMHPSIITTTPVAAALMGRMMMRCPGVDVIA
jgi:hypothetical protein